MIQASIRDVYNTFRNSLRLSFKWDVKKILYLNGTGFLQNSLNCGNDYIIKSDITLGLRLRKWLSLTASCSYNKMSKTNRENLFITYGLKVFLNYFKNFVSSVSIRLQLSNIGLFLIVIVIAESAMVYIPSILPNGVGTLKIPSFISPLNVPLAPVIPDFARLIRESGVAEKGIEKLQVVMWMWVLIVMISIYKKKK